MLAGVLATGLGLVVGIPAALVASWPTRAPRRSDGAVDVGELARLPDGVPVRVPIRVVRQIDAWTAFTDVTLGAAWLVRQGDAVRALSTVCPHAGCSVDWERDKSCFACPCHGSAFAKDGARTDGPSPRGMDPLEVEIKSGRVLVTYRRFRQGVGDRESS